MVDTERGNEFNRPSQEGSKFRIFIKRSNNGPMGSIDRDKGSKKKKFKHGASGKHRQLVRESLWNIVCEMRGRLENRRIAISSRNGERN